MKSLFAVVLFSVMGWSSAYASSRMSWAEYCGQNPRVARCASWQKMCRHNPYLPQCEGSYASCQVDPSQRECRADYGFCQRFPNSWQCRLPDADRNGPGEICQIMPHSIACPY